MMELLAQTEMSLEDFFESTRESVGAGPRIGLLVSLIVICAALLALLLVLNRKRSQELALKPINNLGRLQRDMLDKLKITKEEGRELERAAKEQGMGCLSLLLCPSMLQRAAQASEGESRRVLTGLIKRICA